MSDNAQSIGHAGVAIAAGSRIHGKGSQNLLLLAQALSERVIAEALALCRLARSFTA
jgi:hypothetical protein